MNELVIVVMRKPLRIKLLSKTQDNEITALWSPLIPSQGFENIEFTFEAADEDYDFLAIYEGLPKWENRRTSQRFETLSCSRKNTLLITTEPSSIRLDGPQFMRQFGYILTNKSPVLTRHPNHIAETPPLRWFYGRSLDGSEEHISIDKLTRSVPKKSKDISTVCSTKQMLHTVHAARLDFVMELRKRLPELDVYGRGIQPISDKAEAMRDYRYHIAIENHIEPGHWTEKLVDCFLAGCLPFYFGDPDYAKAFPEQSVIPIDIFDIEGAVQIIRDAIDGDAFNIRQKALQEARKIVLEKYNTLGWIARFARENYEPETSYKNEKIYSRHAFRRIHPVKALSDLLFRTRMRSHPSTRPLQRKIAIPRSSEPD